MAKAEELQKLNIDKKEMETWPAVSRAAYKSSSRKELKTPPVTCRATVVESFTV